MTYNFLSIKYKTQIFYFNTVLFRKEFYGIFYVVIQELAATNEESVT